MITGPLADALKDGRKRFNARYAYHRALNRRLDPDVFADHLERVVNPIVDAVYNIDAGAVHPVTEALYDLSLELISRDCLGKNSRYPAVNTLWETFLPGWAVFLIDDPTKFAAAASNAVYNLTLQNGVDELEWMRRMDDVAAECSSLDMFLDAGKIAAWRCGMAHYRESALNVCGNTPDNLVRKLLGLNEENGATASEIAAALRDPWLDPVNMGKTHQRKLKITAIIGGFRGFDGPFIRPPEVFVSNQVLFAHDNEFCWSIHADVFGAILQRFGADLPDDLSTNSGPFKLNKNGEVTFGGLTKEFAPFKYAASYVSNNDTMALTMPRTHKIILIAPA